MDGDLIDSLAKCTPRIVDSLGYSLYASGDALGVFWMHFAGEFRGELIWVPT